MHRAAWARLVAAGRYPSPMDDSYDALLATAERTLDDVDQALARLDAGTYATCEACGATITEERLAALPTARTCAHHPQLTDQRGVGWIEGS